MATNDMYRQLLSQAVSKNGSALIGGTIGGAMIGGAYFKPTNRKMTQTSGSVGSYGEAGPEAMRARSEAARVRLQNPDVKEKAKAARKSRKNFIDNELLNVYGGRSKISYDERLDAITAAKKQLHLIKTQAAETKRQNRTEGEKKEDARKSLESKARALEKYGFENTKEGRKAFRIAKGYEKVPKTPAQKARDKQDRAEFKAFKAFRHQGNL